MIQRAFGLTLFGFDVIIPADVDAALISTKTGKEQCGGPEIGAKVDIVGSKVEKRQEKHLLVIDINYFPSYKEVSDFPARLRQFLLKKSRQKKLK